MEDSQPFKIQSILIKLYEIDNFETSNVDSSLRIKVSIITVYYFIEYRQKIIIPSGVVIMDGLLGTRFEGLRPTGDPISETE
jgi:hypothetical protein